MEKKNLVKAWYYYSYVTNRNGRCTSYKMSTWFHNDGNMPTIFGQYRAVLAIEQKSLPGDLRSYSLTKLTAPYVQTDCTLCTN